MLAGDYAFSKIALIVIMINVHRAGGPRRMNIEIASNPRFYPGEHANAINLCCRGVAWRLAWEEIGFKFPTERSTWRKVCKEIERIAAFWR